MIKEKKVCKKKKKDSSRFYALLSADFESVILVNFVGLITQSTVFLATVNLQGLGVSFLSIKSHSQTYLLSLIENFVVAAVALLDMQQITHFCRVLTIRNETHRLYISSL